MKLLGIVAITVAVLLAVPFGAQAVVLGDPSVTIASPGKLGVQNASPVQLIHLGDSSVLTSVRFRLENSAGNVDFRTSSGNMDFFINNAQKMRLLSTGRLGLGTSSPATNFHLNVGNTSAVRVRLSNSQGSGDIYARFNGIGFAPSGGNPTIFADNGGNVGIGTGTATPASLLDVAGTATVDILQIDGGADLSEQFNIVGDAEVQPGMVVSINIASPGELVVSSKAYDHTVAGIVSGAGGLNTGMTMGQQGSIADGQHPVALTGRVYCFVDGGYGSVQPGDLLTTSDTPGHAMKVQDYTQAQGAIIGKAMTPLASGEKGLVLVLVTLQ